MGQTDRSGHGNGRTSDNLDQTARLIETLPGFDGFHLDPLALIKAVNFFHRIGFAESLRALRRYGQMGPEAAPTNPENVLLIARVLYVPVDVEETLPHLDLGLPDLEEPQDPHLFPLFPLHLIQDLPLLLIGGYLVGGEGQPPAVYLEWCAAHARLRPAPLHPGSRPLTAVDAFLQTAAWHSLNPDGLHAGMLRLQALQALPPAFRTKEDEQQALLAESEASPSWSAQREKEERINLTWNPSLDEFQAS